MRTSPTTNRFEALRASQQFAYDRAPSIRAVRSALADAASHNLPV